MENQYMLVKYNLNGKDVEQIALDNKVQKTYDEQVAAWEAEAGVEYFYANFGITAASGTDGRELPHGEAAPIIESDQGRSAAAGDHLAAARLALYPGLW